VNVYMIIGGLVLLPVVGSIVVGLIALLTAPFRRRGPREDPPLYTGRMD
jgi:hypothetical protein